jgi:hypothetical protein
MSARLREHFRSNVVGYIALFCFAMSGTAVALDGSNTVFSDDIVDGAVGTADISNTDGVRSLDVRNDSEPGGGLVASDLDPSSVESSEIAPNAVGVDEITTAGVGSNEIAFSAVDADEIGAGIHAHQGTPVSIPGNTAHNGSYDTDDATAACAAGEQLISGSAHWSGTGSDEERWIQSIELDHAAERVTVWGGNDSGITRSLVAVAHCLEV